MASPAAWLPLFAALALASCGGDSVPPRQEEQQHALEGLREAPLYRLDDMEAALRGRSDLEAVDTRDRIRWARLNRSPAMVSEDLEGLDPARRGQEAALRKAWREAHIAWSWDNLDPLAQLEPRPDYLSLAWLTLAARLPLARAGRAFPETWVEDYFSRKAWYRPGDGPLYLSMIDRMQVEALDHELASIPREALESHLAALPLPEMSPEEARVERQLAEALLARRSH